MLSQRPFSRLQHSESYVELDARVSLQTHSEVEANMHKMKPSLVIVLTCLLRYACQGQPSPQRGEAGYQNAR